MTLITTHYCLFSHTSQRTITISLLSTDTHSTELDSCPADKPSQPSKFDRKLSSLGFMIAIQSQIDASSAPGMVIFTTPCQTRRVNVINIFLLFERVQWEWDVPLTGTLIAHITNRPDQNTATRSTGGPNYPQTRGWGPDGNNAGKISGKMNYSIKVTSVFITLSFFRERLLERGETHFAGISPSPRRQPTGHK